jgi:hypothetical protein
LLLGGTGADEITNHNKPSRDPNTHLQRGTCSGLELWHGLYEGEPSSNSGLGVVLVCVRIAEIGKHAVAHVFCDETVMALD